MSEVRSLRFAHGSQQEGSAMTMTPDRQKVDRDEVFLEYTKSICPVCKTVIDGEVNTKDNKVFLRKRCAEHGQFEALLYSDAEMYFDSLRFNKPGTIPLETQTEVKDGCPLDCGLCPEHKQHACLGIIEVNTTATSTARSASPTPDTSPTASRSRWTKSRRASTRSWRRKASPRSSCSPVASRPSTPRSSASCAWPPRRA